MQRRRRDYLMLRRFSGLMFRGRLKSLLDERIGRYQQLRTLWADSLRQADLPGLGLCHTPFPYKHR
jgi:hypothetical protein